MAVKPIPDGYRTVTPFISVKGADKMLDFLKRALGAEEIMKMPGPGGAVLHAEVNIGNSRIMMSETMQGEPTRSWFYLYVNDVDGLYERAIKAGAASQQAPTDQFWGDRVAMVRDAFGNVWSLAVHKEDVPPQELAKRAAAAMVR